MNMAFDTQSLTRQVSAGKEAAIFKMLKDRTGFGFENSYGAPRFALPGMAMDAPPSWPQSSLVTTPNSGIPWFFANWVDPNLIPILLTPMMAAVIAGEVLKGDWLTETVMFMTAEATGETALYGDYQQGGASNFEANFPQRQNCLFQSFMQWGEREIGRYGLAKIEAATKQQEANAMVLAKALNFLYFYGAAGLQNYGLINDPTLPPALTATYSWLGNASATALTIYQDVVRMFIQLQLQAQGTVRMDDEMVLAMSPAQSVALNEVTQYNTNSVKELLKENFPKLRLETAPEYGPPYNSTGQLVQLIAEEVEGQRTVECAFSTKLMAGNMVPDTTSYRQKRWSGGFGSIWYRPFLEVSMIA